MNLVFAVDDDEAVRDSLSLLMESAGFEVEVFELAFAALDRCRVRPPDCIVTDVRMPGMDGLEFQETLLKNGIRVPVIVMTGHGDVRLAVRAMKAGASDFIEKPFSDDAVLNSVTEAIAAAAARRDTSADSELHGRLAILTARERELLDLLAAGDPNKVIAYKLQISPRTVEIHRARVMEKMQAKSLPELVKMALQLGVLPDR